jgi:hypothetical protein
VNQFVGNGLQVFYERCKIEVCGFDHLL